MLHTESDRGERVFDLVRDLPRHLTPRQYALRSRHLDPTQLEIHRQTTRSYATQPQRSDCAGSGRKQNQNAQIASTAIEAEIIAARGRGKHEVLISRTLR